ncbi:putative iron reductase domain protein [Hypoxylon sp. CI-4A]|nr:putative iron reductase domain protein [Hypoxylon sp. CI-4A]
MSAATEAQAGVFRDPDTGFTFSESTVAISTGSDGITFRIAIPSDAPTTGGYDAVVQVVAPNAAGWVGLAWGGSMTNNPLTVGWVNGATGVVSGRRATSHVAPTPDSSATLQVLSKGTKTNGTHWQFTAKCTGCASFTTSGTTTKNLNPAGSNRLAFAYAKSKPSQPSSSSSPINVHDLFNYWDHDFASAGNSGFADLVQKNL